MKQLTKEQAISFYENKLYENMSYRQIAEFQIEQDRLCMPFDIFHEAIQKTLGRPVFTHEFALNREGLKKELSGEKELSTLEDVISLIPKERLILICI